jgi:hypothetical protein
MTRYFFHVFNSRAVFDYVGEELSSNLAARLQAIGLATSTMSGWDANWKGEEWTMIVTDLDGTVILTLKFSGNFGTTH